MYLALYRKYRPSTFDDVISQEHITTTLKNQIATGQIAHAYLFTGTRGTGKTSCAKIMAKAVNCLSPVNGNPCGECKSCKAIAEGSTDIIEIDAASNNGVDSIRQIRDEVIYTPIDCKYKVYIIDEVHMLSDSAFNALLKTLEEPPEHAVFILATTEYYKVPATILSRCQQFLFSKIDPAEAKKRLLEVAAKENVSLTENAAALIARLSDGAMRDAWSLLDQCISSVGGQVDEEAVRACSGVADSGYLFAVTEAVIGQKPADALKLLDDLIGAGKDLLRFTEELTLHFRNIMLAKSVGTDFIKGTDEEIKRYGEQCEKLSLDEIMRHVDLLSDSLDNINRMKQTGQGRLLTEQLLIRLCSPALSNDAASLAARLGAVENRIKNLSLNITAAPVGAKTEDKPVSVPDELPKKQADITSNERSDKNTEANAKAEEKVKTGANAKENAQTQPAVFPFDLDEPQPAEAPPSYETDIPLPEPPFDYESGYIPPPEEPPFDTVSKNVSAPYYESSPLVRTNTDKPAGAINTASDNGTNTAIDAPKSAPETEDGTKDNAEKSAPNSGKAKSKALPITESNIELPEDIKPLAQWEDIIARLSSRAKNLLNNKSRAFLYEGKIYIEASPSALTVIKSGSGAEKLRTETAAVMGGKFDIFTLPEKSRSEEEKEDLITPFLDRARDMGIEVTVKNK